MVVMAPENTKNEAAASVGSTGNNNDEVPHSIIAQAEAAIIGEFNDEEPLRRARSAGIDYSQYQPVHRSKGGVTTTHLEVPDDLDPDSAIEAPPAYGDRHDRLSVSQDGFDTQARVTKDGRINININQKTRKLSNLLVPALRQQLSLVAQEEEKPLPPGYIPPALGGLPGQNPPPKLNVVIHVVGSRGDVQPFVALGRVLKSTYGHRVRLATHPTFKSFVEENGLEFFSIGGDPSELMAFMVKNPGMMPGFDSLKNGEVGKRRKGMEEIVLGCWRSCIESGDGLGAPVSRLSSENLVTFEAGINMDVNPADQPFIADAIIANPPSFAHIHIAEKLGVPLHMMFTMPWSPTQQFPHPLANIQSSNADVNMTNFVSYALVEMMTWQGLGDVINRFRERALGLEPISLIWAPGMLTRLRVPYTYCWSPALIPKPKDWGQNITISGFYFLSLASSYTPDPELAAYLAAGPPPVYIGFGSIVVDNPDAMTKMIFEAVKKAGIRALVSKGWGGLGGDSLEIPEGIFMLGNVPHDWLFQHVSCVVHHGGAGTTAAGIATGKPTVVVPFFGDQPFWGAMTARAGAGPLPIPYKSLTADKLAAAILDALKPETLKRAQELGASIKEEKGTEVGGKSFHDFLDVDALRCSLAPSRVAVWRIKRTDTKLSALAANVLAGEGLLDFADLKLYRPREYETEEGPWDPISGGASALLGTITSLGMGFADFPIELFKGIKKEHTIRKENATKNKLETSDSSPLSPTVSESQTLLELDSQSTTTPIDTNSRHGSESSSTPKTSSDNTRSSTDVPETPLSSIASSGGSLKQALRGALGGSSPRSNSKDRSSLSRSNSKDRKPGSRSGSAFGHRRRETEEFDPSKLTLEHVTRTGKSVSRIVGAGLKSPMDFSLGIARGFHNAPKLYGDDTVRPQTKVTDLQSGLKAAGKEFGYGFYDGITGLVMQPLRGAEREGAAGLVKGIGKGIGGLILKPGAAIWGLPGYTFMGINKEIKKMFGSSVTNYIITARTTQGYEDAKNSTYEERLEIINRWRLHKDEYQNLRMKVNEVGGPEGQESGRLTPKGFMQTRHLTFDERKKLSEERKLRRQAERRRLEAEQGPHGNHRFCPFCRRSAPHSHEPRALQTKPIVTVGANQDHFEQAIYASVSATSRGNAEEDLMIERAIRASVRELQGSEGSTLTGEEALNRAIQASIIEAGREKSDEQGPDITMTEEEAEQQALLEKAIQASLAQYQLTARAPAREDDDDDDGDDTDDDENIKKALQMSEEEMDKEESAILVDEQQQIKLALQKSNEEFVRNRNEEEIVLDYVRNQSLIEEQQRKKTEPEAIERGRSHTAPEPSEAATPSTLAEMEEYMSPADEEALRLAIEESMRDSHGDASRTS